jgi:hypothetical protein
MDLHLLHPFASYGFVVARAGAGDAVTFCHQWTGLAPQLAHLALQRLQFALVSLEFTPS